MRAMFHSIAPRYDFITACSPTAWIAGGNATAWTAPGFPSVPASWTLPRVPATSRSWSICLYPDARPVAVDLTERMLTLARGRGLTDTVCGDAGVLPFADASFDCVFIGYGLRSFPDLSQALREIVRVTRPGGLFVSLDFFLPELPVWRQLYLGYLYAQGAFWGVVLHGRARTYTYIPDSLRNFLSIKAFSSSLEMVGYRPLKVNRYILGGIGLHLAAKNRLGGSRHPQ